MGMAVRLRVRVAVRFMVIGKVSIGVYFMILVCKSILGILRIPHLYSALYTYPYLKHHIYDACRVMLFNASNARNTRKLYVIGTAYIVAGVY